MEFRDGEHVGADQGTDALKVLRREQRVDGVLLVVHDVDRLASLGLDSLPLIVGELGSQVRNGISRPQLRAQGKEPARRRPLPYLPPRGYSAAVSMPNYPER